MKYLLALFMVILLALAVTSRAQQLNPGGGILVPITGIFDWLLVGPVGTTPPAPGTVNAVQYEVNGTLLGVANMGDYAVGPWQPTLVGLTTPGTPAYSVQVGSFEKIGRQVTARFYLATTNLGGLAGAVTVAGLPYPNGNTPNDMGACSISVWSGVTMLAGFTQLSAIVTQAASFATFYMGGSGQGPGVLQGANLGASVIFVGMCNYHT